ncbi:PREDICTED: uncharacterized protein LOC104710419 [Camelina sativa]|uniref:Uncharacterized protein LOC104710419 n=1 Tax=Camelina sativa TaxID=90675 RepID=A0ABM1QGP7_CAMSA|nr:PREDICTED: uncharacterized protein LOC104710419 [Camelina sativa]
MRLLRLASSSMVKSPVKSQILSMSRGSIPINLFVLGCLVFCLKKSSVMFTISKLCVRSDCLSQRISTRAVAREFSLRRSLQLLSKREKALPTYCREFKAICDSLSSIGKPVDESMKIFGFLNGLGRDYDPITTFIQSSLSKLQAPTFNDVIAEVQGFDKKLQSYEDTSSPSPHLAFNTDKTNPCALQYQPNNRGKGRFGQNRGRGGYSSRGRGFPQHQSSCSSQGERPVCQICGRIGHTAIKCYNRFDNNYQSEATTQAFSSLRVSDDSGREWHPDSGATAHVTSSTSGLHATAYKGNDTVMVGDGAYLPFTHVGSTIISSAKESGVKGFL